MTRFLEHTFAADGESLEITIGPGSYPVSISGLTAAGAGSVALQRSTDSGVIFGTVKLPDFTDANFTADAEFNLKEDSKVIYRFVMSSYSSGAIVCRIGQKGL